MKFNERERWKFNYISILSSCITPYKKNFKLFRKMKFNFRFKTKKIRLRTKNEFSINRDTKDDKRIKVESQQFVNDLKMADTT